MASKNIVRCGFSGCNRFFSSEKELVRHKVRDPDHEYCPRCNLDFDTEEEMFIHLITSPKHHACPHCAEEFKSEGGLTLHIRKSHPASADIACVGCATKFYRAAQYMAHIEKDECQILRRKHYELQRAQKQLIKDAFQMSLNDRDYDEPPVFQKKADSVADTEDGGVSLGLMDTENMPLSGLGHDFASHNALEAGQNEISSNTSCNPRPYQRHFATEEQDWPELGGPAYKYDATRSGVNNDLIDMVSRISQNPTYKWNNFAGTPTAQRLFPEAKATPPMAVAASTARIETESALQDSTKDLHLRSFSVASGPSTSSKYDVWNFYNDMVKRFLCPSRQCAGKFKTVLEFQDHLLGEKHTGGSARCPLCFRYFRHTYALVAHCESSTTRCKINQSANYNQIMRELTGDLIGTKGHREDGSVWYVADPDVLGRRGDLR